MQNPILGTVGLPRDTSQVHSHAQNRPVSEGSAATRHTPAFQPVAYGRRNIRERLQLREAHGPQRWQPTHQTAEATRAHRTSQAESQRHAAQAGRRTRTRVHLHRTPATTGRPKAPTENASLSAPCAANPGTPWATSSEPPGSASHAVGPLHRGSSPNSSALEAPKPPTFLRAPAPRR